MFQCEKEKICRNIKIYWRAKVCFSCEEYSVDMNVM